MGKTWPALDIHVPSCDPHLHGLVFAELDDFQPTAMQEPDDTSWLRAFFASAESRDAAARALGACFGIHLFLEPLDVDDEDWASRSQAQLRAITIGRLVVAPPWDVAGSAHHNGRRSEVGTAHGGALGGADTIVVIQPSMGFGTGHHATTRLVLKALQQLALDNQTVLDIGCGSGVLAIAAVKLGARSAVGIDVDPDALANARDNAGLNDMGDRVRFDETDFREMTVGANVVLANLTGGLLVRSAPKLRELVAPGGFLIVSGFMDSENAAVVPTLERFLGLQNIAQEEEWMCATYSSRGG